MKSGGRLDEALPRPLSRRGGAAEMAAALLTGLDNQTSLLQTGRQAVRQRGSWSVSNESREQAERRRCRGRCRRPALPVAATALPPTWRALSDLLRGYHGLGHRGGDLWFESGRGGGFLKGLAAALTCTLSLKQAIARAASLELETGATRCKTASCQPPKVAALAGSCQLCRATGWLAMA
jgi:hypothetical protein